MFGAFWTFNRHFARQGAKGFGTLPKVSKTWRSSGSFKNGGRRGHLPRTSKDAVCVAGAVQETSSSKILGGQGRSSGLLWCFCATVQHLVWPGLTFLWQARYFRDMGSKNRKAHWYEAVTSALSFHVWRKSRRSASFFMLPTSKIEEVWQNRCVIGIVNVQI